MNTRTIGLIIKREYLTRVKKKSFLLITFLSPLLFAALCILPSLIMIKAKEESKKVAVIDESGIVMPYMESGESAEYTDCSGFVVDDVKLHLEELGYDAVLRISPLDTLLKTVSADIYSVKPIGMDLSEIIKNRINSAVEDYRIDSYNIAGLNQIMQDVKSNVKLKSYTVSDDGKETISESGVFMAVSMVLGIIIYMFIIMFGGMVMSSVIEEKSSRVVEVLISSVKATELMFGKIIGIALVALTQFLLWVLLTGAIVGVVGSVAGQSLFAGASPEQAIQAVGVDASQTEAIASIASDSDAASVIITTLGNMPIAQILVCFLLFFIFGYMLYASLFAAIGSAVENDGDSQQLQMPLTIPLLIAFFIAMYTFKAPDSGISFWGSIIPFTSPIVMLARIPFGVPVWEIILSVVLLIATFVVCAWASAKIYNVGILMFGKKSSWKDLWRWLKQK